MSKALQFRKAVGADGIVRCYLVGDWEPEIIIDQELIAAAYPFIQHNWSSSTIRFTVANGNAEYRIVGENHLFQAYIAELVESDRHDDGPNASQAR